MPRRESRLRRGPVWQVKHTVLIYCGAAKTGSDHSKNPSSGVWVLAKKLMGHLE